MITRWTLVSSRPYCVAVTEPLSLGDVIAERIRHYRQAKGWSIARLTKECDQLTRDADGIPIPGTPRFSHASLSNIERGRADKRGRRDLLVTELPILARALGVAPVLLLFRVAESTADEALPGTVADPFDTAQWFAGERPHPADGSSFEAFAAWEANNAPIVLTRQHEDLIRQWAVAGQAPEPAAARAPLEAALRQVRDALRARRLVTPALPLLLAHVDAADPHSSSRCRHWTR